MKTHVIMLLDESSSMVSYRSAVVETFNNYVDKLKEGKRTWLSLFKFAGNRMRGVGYDPFNFSAAESEAGALRTVFENRRVTEAYPLTIDQYKPNGWTPLYDSIGELIQRTKKRLPKKAKVLFVIHTDGQENTSRKYNQERVKNLIKRMEKKRGWTFVYLGEGAAAWNAGYDFGVDNVANFSSTLRGQSMDKLATATMAYSCSNNVGGAFGATKTFYADANLTADDIDPNEHVSITPVAQDDIEADNS